MLNLWSDGKMEFLFFAVRMNDKKEKFFAFSSCRQLWNFFKNLAESSFDFMDENIKNAIKYMIALMAFLLSDAPPDEQNSNVLMDILVATRADPDEDPVKLMFIDYENDDARFRRTGLEEEFREISIDMYHEYEKIPIWEKQEVISRCLNMVCMLNSEFSDFYSGIYGECHRY